MLQLKNILVPTDCSNLAHCAYSYGAELARRFDAQLHVIHVHRPGHSRERIPASLLPVTKQDRPDDFPRTASPLRQPIEAVVESASAPRALIDYAREHEVDLIVMGGRSRTGLRLPTLGSVAAQVVRTAHCPVLTVRHRMPSRGLRRILVPTDFSEPSRAILTLAKGIAALTGAHVDLLHVLSPSYEPTTFGIAPPVRLAPQVLGKWEAHLRDLWKEVEGPEAYFLPHVRAGSPGPEIINFALQYSSDLIVISTHGRTGFRRLVMGSVAEFVANHALCATLTVRSTGVEPMPPTGGKTAHALGHDGPPTEAESLPTMESERFR